jgi:hypothetical protein
VKARSSSELPLLVSLWLLCPLVALECRLGSLPPKALPRVFHLLVEAFAIGLVWCRLARSSVDLGPGIFGFSIRFDTEGPRILLTVPMLNEPPTCTS